MKPVIIIKKDSYNDSVFLMQLSARLKKTPGVADAVVAMGTPMNLELLEKSGYAKADFAGAGPNDLVAAVKAEGLDKTSLEALLKESLAAKTGKAAKQRPVGLTGAVKDLPEAGLVMISLPGEHAAREARRSLALGKHVLLFSDNVSVEEELALKQDAVAKGLLMMGPDCGTAIINGKPLAFANVVRRGAIGVVGASGTGVQEVTCIIHRLGGGVSQAIGTGGRDLSKDIGGLMSLLGLEALAADPDTKVLVFVSKPPAAEVKAKIEETLRRCPKPAVIHMVGAEVPSDEPSTGLYFADSLAAAAEKACVLLGLKVTPEAEGTLPSPETIAKAMNGRKTMKALFCGGTTGAESLVLLGRAGLAIKSNLHKKGELRIEGETPEAGHVLLDLGDDIFTRGRPHPMIEPVLRNERLMLEGADPDAGLLLFDCVLGYGSHDDPAGLLADGVTELRRKLGFAIPAIASITGTDLDPQDFHGQKKKLEDAGILVASDNRKAALLAAAVLGRRG